MTDKPPLSTLITKEAALSAAHRALIELQSIHLRLGELRLYLLQHGIGESPQSHPMTDATNGVAATCQNLGAFLSPTSIIHPKSLKGDA